VLQNGWDNGFGLLVADNSTMNKLLGAPAVSFDEGIADYCKYFLESAAAAHGGGE